VTRENGVYSLITYDDGDQSHVLGVVVFPRTGELAVGLRADFEDSVEDGRRIGMAARALVNRVRRAAPRTFEDVRSFAAREPNEVTLSGHREVSLAEGKEAALSSLLREYAPRAAAPREVAEIALRWTDSGVFWVTPVYGTEVRLLSGSYPHATPVVSSGVSCFACQMVPAGSFDRRPVLSTRETHGAAASSANDEDVVVEAAYA
jgi:hypothetical protein